MKTHGKQWNKYNLWGSKPPLKYNKKTWIFVIQHPTHHTPCGIPHTIIRAESIQNYETSILVSLGHNWNLINNHNNVNKADELHMLLCVQCILSLTQYIDIQQKRKCARSWGNKFELGDRFGNVISTSTSLGGVARKSMHMITVVLVWKGWQSMNSP